MRSLINIGYTDNGFMIVLFGLFGVGASIDEDESSKSATISVKIYKFNTFLTFAIM